MMHSIVADTESDTQDRESQERSVNDATPSIVAIPVINSSGYYDAEKCRAYIANQIKVSKIDRFAAQVGKALEVEADIQSRLGRIVNMFVKHSARVAHDFSLRCKLGLQRHRQDRILNQQRKMPSKNASTITRRISDNRRQHHSIGNDLLYGHGAQLVHALLTQSVTFTNKHIKRKQTQYKMDQNKMVVYSPEKLERDCGGGGGLSEDDYLMSDFFEPTQFVKQLDDHFRDNERKSIAITNQLNTIRQLFERLASEHRDKVDLVYAAEEERQAATVIRRSAYNLSMAAIKATSTPIHVNNLNNEVS